MHYAYLLNFQQSGDWSWR